MHQVRAELSNVDSENRTVEVVWSTGSKGLRSGWDGPYYEELSMDPKHVDMERLNAGTAPVLAAHNQESLDGVIGVVERAWLDNGQGKALLRFSASDPAADMAFKKIQERILRNVSVGYSVQEYTDMSTKSDKVPTYLATRWQPQEISIVPIGFDMNATTRSQNTIENEVEILLRSETVEETRMKETQQVETPVVATPAVEPVVAAAPIVDVAALQEQASKSATLAERTRIQEIRKAVTSAKFEDAMAEDFITRNLTTAEASKEIFKKMEDKQTQIAGTTPSVEITRDEKEVQAQGLENALLHRASKNHKLDDNGKRFFGMSLVRIAEEILGGRKGGSELALATRAMTTSDLPNILANVAEKSMRMEYQLQTPSFQDWTKANTLRNFKTANRLMLGDFPQLEQVDEHGEFKAGAVSESKETIKLVRYGKSIAFTKEMIVNDDLHALVDFSTKSARAASRLESNLVYQSVLAANPTMGDGNALFSSAHNNLAGSGTDITIAAVGAGWEAIANQLTLDGDYADLTPKFLIVGPSKEIVARQFVSQNMLAINNSTINPFAGRLQVITDPRISGTNWYLAADPSQIDTIELVRLESENGPLMYVEQKVNGNIKITCEHSAGAAALDFRGLYKNPGA